MHTGAQSHKVIQTDPLGLGAVKLDIGVWAHRDSDQQPPSIGSYVLVLHYPEEDRWYWICVLQSSETVDRTFTIQDADEDDDEYYDDEDEWDLGENEDWY